MPEHLQKKVKLFASVINFKILTKTCSLNKIEVCILSLLGLVGLLVSLFIVSFNYGLLWCTCLNKDSPRGPLATFYRSTANAVSRV